MMVIPVLSLLVTMVTRCQSMWHLQLSSRSELRNHGDGEGGELCVSRFRWGCRLLPCLAQRLPGQAQRQGGCFCCWSLDSKSEEGQKEVEEEERKEGEERERWKEMFEGRGYERKRRSGDRLGKEGVKTEWSQRETQ